MKNCNITTPWTNLKRIYKIMFNYWGYVIGGLLTTLVYALMNGISITLIVPVLDVVLKSKSQAISIFTSSDFFFAIRSKIELYIQSGLNLLSINDIRHSGVITDLNSVLNQTNPFLVLKIISVFIISLFVVKNIFYYLNKIMFTNLRGRSVRDIRNLMFSKYLSQSLRFFNINKVGDSMVRLDNDVSIVSNEFISNLFIVIRDFSVMLSCLIVAYLMNPRLFLISLLVVPMFAISINYIGKKMKKYAQRIQEQYSSMFSQVEEALNNIRIIKAFNKENHELDKYRQINDKYRKLWQRSEIYNSFNIPISEISSALIGSLLLLIAGRELLSHNSSFTLGEFTAFLIAIFATLHPLRTLTKAYADIKKALISLERISWIINLQPEIQEDLNPIDKSTFEKDITFNKVSFYYGENTWILKDISFVINKGETVAIIGESGSGKTTLVNLLTRMYDVSEGEINIDDIPIKKVRINSLTTLFGIVPQESQLFSNTFLYNIQYGNQRELSLQEVREAAQIAYADEFIEKYPDTYNHLMQTKGSDLSGGQKQRICIARAIAADPPILVFDEATSSLDSDSEQKVQDAINRATENRTVIIIAHRLSTILNADKIVVLEKGRIAGIGKHEILIDECPKYQHLFNMQFKNRNNSDNAESQ